MMLRNGVTVCLALAAIVVVLGLMGSPPRIAAEAADAVPAATERSVTDGAGKAPRIACAENLLADAGFEGGALSPYWQESVTGVESIRSIAGDDGASSAYAGTWWAWFGGDAEADTEGALWQEVVIPDEDVASLQFYLSIPIAETPGRFQVYMDDALLFQVTEADQKNYAEYRLVTVDATRFADGLPHVLRFSARTQAGGMTHFFLDEICLQPAEPEGVGKTAPEAPTGLVAEGQNTGSIQVSWNASAGAKGYQLEYSGSADGGFAPVSGGAVSGTEYLHSGLESGSQYFYRVNAYNDDGTSAYSSLAAGGTHAVLTVAIKGGSDGVRVTGPGLECPGNCKATYPYGEQVVLLALAGDGAPLAEACSWDGAKSTGENHAEVVMDGDKTVTLSFLRGAPFAPSNLVVTAVPADDPALFGRSKLRIQWQDNSSNETSFELQWALAAGGPWNGVPADLPPVAGSGATGTYVHTDLDAGTRYYYRIRSCKSDDAPPCSDYSAVASGLTLGVIIASRSGVGGTDGTVYAPPGPGSTGEYGINCGDDCIEEYQIYSSLIEPYEANFVELTAVAQPGSVFLRWQGLTADDTTNFNVCQVRRNGNRQVTAVFGVDPCLATNVRYTISPWESSTPPQFLFRNLTSPPSGYYVSQVKWYISEVDPEEVESVWCFPIQFTVDFAQGTPVSEQFVTVGLRDYPYMRRAGEYIVGMRVRLQNNSDPNDYYWCPSIDGDIGSEGTCPVPQPYIAPDPENPDNDRKVVVTEETASFDAVDLICDQDSMALVPLNDWVPLFQFNMSYSPESPAPRVLTMLEFIIHADTAPERGYTRSGGPRERDIMEFGLFVDTGPLGEPDQLFNRFQYDGRYVWRQGGFQGLPTSGFTIEPGEPMLRWRNNGVPYEMPNFAGNYEFSDGVYRLNFALDPRPLPRGTAHESATLANFYPAQPNGFRYFDRISPDNPYFPFLQTIDNYPGSPLYKADVSDSLSAIRNWVIAGSDPGRGYIVAMRTSSIWASTQTMGITVTSAYMQPWNGPAVTNERILLDSAYPHDQYIIGEFPVDEEGNPKDSYSPDFFASPPNYLQEECGYSSSFDVFDITGDTITGYQPGRWHNVWNYQQRMYTPVAEHTRSRWDISDTFVQVVSGEWLDIRRLFSVDAWVPVIGINMHGECTEQPTEVNLILTDIGADPYGPPGNGGFDPNEALERMTTESSGTWDFAVQSDYSFNGAWLFHDTGGSDNCGYPTANCGADGIFTPPTPADPSGTTFGVTFTDYPMIPQRAPQGGFVNAGVNQWEYVPFPPGGGDPWWKIRLRFSGGRRRSFSPEPPCKGFFEGTPDALPTWLSVPDYFVVLRTDSGFQDVSGQTGDGIGMKLGADFRAFIEPRRWNPRHGGHWDGGILTSNMYIETETAYWQDSPTLDTVNDQLIAPQPWWHERLHNRDNVKPVRFGIDVHDMALTYSSYNTYAKETYIHPAQIPPTLEPWVLLLAAKYGITTENLFNLGGLTYFSLWMDPPRVFVIGPGVDLFGIMGYRFYNLFAPGIQWDMSEGIFFSGAPIANNDQLTGIQYSFETVPFSLRPEDATVAGVPGAELEFPRSAFYPYPPKQPTLPHYVTWPPRAVAPDGFPSTTILLDNGQFVTYSEAYGFSSIAWLDPVTAANNEPYFEVTSGTSEATYADDIYYVELLDCGICGSNLMVDSNGDPAELWLIDRYGAKYRVIGQSGSVLTLEHAHAVYMDKHFDGSTNTLDVPDYPFGVPTGPENAIQRGAWLLARSVVPNGQYPRMSDWPAGLHGDEFPEVAEDLRGVRAARLLKQHIGYNSLPTAVLGLNLTGSDDPVVNRHAPTTLNSITVAFWGPEFDKSDLAKLDSTTGSLFSSGVMLYEDTNGTGTFEGPFFFDISPVPVYRDRIVPLEPSKMKWPNAPEPIDLDGDNIPDDISGDGIVTADGVTCLREGRLLSTEEVARWDGLSDLAWVLQLQPQMPWTVPDADTRSGEPSPPEPAYSKSLLGDPIEFPGAKMREIGGDWPSFWTKTPTFYDLAPLMDDRDSGVADMKALARGGNPGQDLFVVARTSSSIGAFKQFRCVIPARLPSRSPLHATYAGVDITRALTSLGSAVGGPYEKISPDEGAVQDFYGHDMLEVSVPTRMIDLTDKLIPAAGPVRIPLITPGSRPIALLGIDVATNRPEHLIASGEQGETVGNTFTTVSVQAPADSLYYTSMGWTDKAIGLWVVAMGPGEGQDSRLEAWEITNVSNNSLTLRGGGPRNGAAWKVVKDPTFLEQIIVEFYDQSSTSLGRQFNPTNDLLPLDIEDPVNGRISGVSLYRDMNNNGVFDPPILNTQGELEYVDLPVRLDDPPVFIGVQGEPEYQVKMVFSSPGTDNSTGRDQVDYETQPNLRQWVPLSFGETPEEENYGAEFFVVVRTSRDMIAGDQFRAAIVSWGPDTPTEPDPDTFSNVLGSSQQEMEFKKFSEFPWGSRGLGFITFFQERPPVYYWSYDPVAKRTVPRKELDHSQDDRSVKYWVRSNPHQSLRTNVITATAPTKVDFTSDRRRQVPGGEIKFTLIATGQVVEILWDFGDGQTSTDRNPTHVYQQEGLYTVTVTVIDPYGIAVTETKVDYIEILNAPFADFIGDPTDGTMGPDLLGNQPPGLDVQFTDLSVGTDTLRAQSYYWSFGDGSTGPEQLEQNPLHRYTREGFYTVTLEVTFIDSTTGAKVVKNLRRPDYITVRPGTGYEGEGEGETEEIPPADFKVDSLIRDKESLLPLTDWVPLINFRMGYAADNPAPRYLRSIIYEIRPDKREPKDLRYGNFGAPDVTDLLEFGLFVEYPSDEDGENLQLDEDNDYLLYVWDSMGMSAQGRMGRAMSRGTLFGVRYMMDFIGNGTAENPQFPLPAAVNADDGLEGASYILAVRTSATWRTKLTMACDVLAADMIVPGTGAFPRNNEGAPVDSYAPNFFDGEALEPEAAYSSSFAAWDISSSPAGLNVPYFFDSWNNPSFMHIPPAEFTRPRWNKFDQLMDIMAGQFLELRTVVSLDTWVPLIGINLHSTKALHFDWYEAGLGFRDVSSKDAAQLREVNVVLTDIGGDPFGAPGSGGFNPSTGLYPSTDSVWGGLLDEGSVFGPDVSFNGLWVWHDTNNNGLFDAPTMLPEGGIQFNGDFPMLPDAFANNYLSPEYSVTGDWEHIAFPPGGGDPWWRTTMRFYEGRRRPLPSILEDGDIEGFVEKTPDNHVVPYSGSQYSCDYFVVVRTNSGFQNVSLAPPTGSGLTMGADFRAFIEPRRVDSRGNTRGGIYVDSMIPTMLTTSGSNAYGWQEDYRWGASEPWWPQRTVNAKSTKPVRFGLEVHDMILTYTSDSNFYRTSDIFFGDGSIHDGGCLGFAIPYGDPTDFDFWMDPFGLERNKFLNLHTVGVTRWRLYGNYNFVIDNAGSSNFSVQFAYDDSRTMGQFAYETVPFFKSTSPGSDLPPNGPRSAAYTMPPVQPDLPWYNTWPASLLPGEYPRASDWTPEDLRARLLTQKEDIDSFQIPVLGLNLAGSADPIVNSRNAMSVASITVAFWGPDFKPEDLASLDPNGLDINSGVMLFEDADQNGTFLIGKPFEPYLDNAVPISGFDQPVRLRNLAWSSAAEFIDLDGDGIPDDMNGDGALDDQDKAWVLTMTPQNLWEVPQQDIGSLLNVNINIWECGSFDFSKGGLSADDDANRGKLEVLDKQSDAAKALDITQPQPGNDLFITTRLSETPRRFQKIRAVIPATLPERPDGQRKAGVQFFPQVNTSASAFLKRNPDEDAVQDFYGHDMLEVNVPVRVVDITNQAQVITIGGAALPALGLDISTNRGTAAGTLASGNSGVGATNSFSVSGAAWTPGAFAGDWLVDSRFETYEIVGNTANQLTLFSGQPRDGQWRIVRDPSFLEQVIVEFYNVGADEDFNPFTDLLPLDIDQQISGVALYRDNDAHPNNRNGVFDPGVDIPLALDAPPVFTGQTSEDIKVKFVFSSPGTDDVPIPRAQQARNRQWVHDTFGRNSTDPAFGPDFFVVVRASQSMKANANFRAGIVSWGPNTPTEPDPDTWARLTGEERNDFTKFQEFPWGSRALGFITYFKEPPTYYYMDGYRAGQRQDSSGFDWIRTHSTKKRRSSVITARTEAVSPTSVVISSASTTRLPAVTAPGGFNLVINGQGFGTSPSVVISGYTVAVTQATDTAIHVSISSQAGNPPQEPIVLIVRNPSTNKEASRSDLFRLMPGAGVQPIVTRVNPVRGTKDIFPITIIGQNFPDMDSTEVYLGRTRLPVISVSADGTQIGAGFPAGGLPDVGPLTVKVQNKNNGTEGVLLNGFDYVNEAVRNKIGSAFGCAPQENGGPGSVLGDMMLMALLLAGLTAALRRKSSHCRK